ncbi:MAG: winged helix-turn-helix domain-containing protein [Candidatus Baldrarchaeia archaeon]
MSQEVMKIHRMMMRLTAELRDIYEDFLGKLYSVFDEMPLEGNGAEISERIVSLADDFYRKLVWRVIRFIRLSVLPEAAEGRDSTSGGNFLDVIKKFQEAVKSRLLADMKYRVLSVLENAKSMTYKDLAKVLGISESSLRKYIRELEALNFVKVDKSVRPFRVVFLGAPWVYSASELSV